MGAGRGGHGYRNARCPGGGGSDGAPLFAPITKPPDQRLAVLVAGFQRDRRGGRVGDPHGGLGSRQRWLGDGRGRTGSSGCLGRGRARGCGAAGWLRARRCRGLGRPWRRNPRGLRGGLAGILRQERSTLRARPQPLDGCGERVGHLDSALLRLARGLRGRTRAESPRHLRCGRGLGPVTGVAQQYPEPAENCADLAEQPLHAAVPFANPRELTFGALTGGALGEETPLDLLGAALALGAPGLQVGFGLPQRGTLGARRLLGFRELALDRVDPGRELHQLALAGGCRPCLGGGTRAALALEPREALLRLDPQLLLGVLTLLDPSQLALPLGAVHALRLAHRGPAAPLLLGLLEPRLQAGDLAFQRLDGRLRRLP